MDRRIELENFIVNCCENSSIYYEGKYQSVKYLCGLGKIVFFEQSRMLDYVEEMIPNYDPQRDEPILMEIMLHGDRANGCESHEYQDHHYCYTFMLGHGR